MANCKICTTNSECQACNFDQNSLTPYNSQKMRRVKGSCQKIDDCPDFFYDEILDEEYDSPASYKHVVCKNCLEGCQKCDEPLICIECAEPLILSLDAKSCVAQCETQQYESLSSTGFLQCHMCDTDHCYRCVHF